ncbi:MAG: hypothetical protein K8T89_07280 [Planctomycetes bacterium]|nr:hypothetical protein [Planctomycetota bacterium]
MRLFAVLVLVLLPSILAAQVPKAPAERTVDELILDLRNGTDAQKTQALKVMQKLGPKAKKAVPDLVAALSRPEWEFRLSVMNVLGAIGPDAKDAVPALKLELAKYTTADNAQFVIAPIIKILRGVDRDTAHAMVKFRYQQGYSGVITFAHLGTYSKELTPFLIEFLEDTDVVVRQQSARTFMEMRGKLDANGIPLILKLRDAGKPLGPALFKRLEDDDIDVAQFAANALTGLDPQLGTKVIPLVVKWCKTRMCSAEVAANILRPIARDAIPAAIASFDFDWQIALCMAKLDEAYEPLLKALAHEKSGVRYSAAVALRARPKDVATSAPALAARLMDPDLDVRIVVADALVRLEAEQIPDVAASLVKVLREGTREQQLKSLMTLRRAGEPGEPAVPEIQRLLDSEDETIRDFAASALISIKPSAASKAVPMLCKNLNEKMPGYGSELKSLAAIGPPAHEALAQVRELLKFPDWQTRIAAAEAMARIDPKLAETGTKFICDILRNQGFFPTEEPRVLLGSLQRIGPAAKSAVPLLEKMLSTCDYWYDAEIAVTALAIGKSEIAEAVIRKHLNDPQERNTYFRLIQQMPVLKWKVKRFLPKILDYLKVAKVPQAKRYLAEIIAVMGPDAKAAGLRPRLAMKNLTPRGASMQRHYLFPVLALFILGLHSRAEDQPVVVAPSPKAGGHIHPSICRTKDGTLVVVYKGPQVLMRTRSTDGGKTWEKPEEIATSAKRPNVIRETKIYEIYPGTVDTLPDDRLVTTWNYIADEKAKDGYYERALLYSISSDQGKTWSDQALIGPIEKTHLGAVRHNVLPWSEGRWLLPLRVGPPRLFDPKTGKLEVLSVKESPAKQPAFQQISRTAKGTLLAMGPVFLRSTDEGKTWTPIKDFPAAPDGDSAEGRYLTTLSDGRVLVTWGVGTMNKGLRYNFSADDGVTWRKDPVTLLPETNVAARYYSARTVQVDEQNIGTVYLTGSVVYFLKVKMDRVAK